MTNQQLLSNIFQLPHKLGTQKSVKLDYATISYSDTDASVLWNNALVNTPLTEDKLNEIEKVYRNHDRNPAIYFENKPELDSLKHFLQVHGYQEEFEDSWMVYAKKNIDTDYFDLVHKVRNEQELHSFISVFNECYQKDDPQNPYGDQSCYLPILEKSWRNNSFNNSFACFIVYDKSEPVAVGSLTNIGDIGYISNIGSLPRVRGKGFGKLITLYCVWQSQQNGCTVPCLGTEEGTYANQFYEWLGFKTQFTAFTYAKRRGF